MKEDKNKFNAFKNAHSLSDWEVAAREELNGADSWEKLTYKGDGWSILPFYERKTSPLPLLPLSPNEFLGARTWYNCPAIRIKDAKMANGKALECLREGADGIFFELPDEVDFEILLKDIDWQYCSLNFLAKKNQVVLAAALNRYITEKSFSEKSIQNIHGAFFGNEVFLPGNKGFCFMGFQTDELNSPVEELVGVFRKVTQSSDHWQVAFSISINTDFFLSIAKLRAIRLIWKKYLSARKVKSDIPVFIHAQSPAWIDSNFQPHGNMLKSTTAAMAAILGGCDALTIEPEDPNHKMMSRVARNVSNVLREESYFSKVADPLAGSYFIEDLTNQLTEAAWKSIELLLPK